MIRTRFLFLVVSALPTFGCGLLIPQGTGVAGARVSPASLTAYTQASKDIVRKSEKMKADSDEAVENEQLDKMEKDAEKALNQVLGKAPQFPGGPLPESSSAAALALRKSKVSVRVEPVTDADGNAGRGEDFFTLKDSFSDRVLELQRKLVEQRASKAEKKEVLNGSKYVMKVNDLRSAVAAISFQAYRANAHVQSSSLETMLFFAQMVRTRKLMDMDLSGEDYARVKGSLERGRRGEAIAASMTGMLAAYQAVLNDRGDPKALDAVAEGTLNAFPVKVTVTAEEAKSYVENLGDHVAEQKAKYEQMMRKTYGDAKYEKLYKANIDAMFNQAAGAQSQRSATQIAAERRAQRLAPGAGAGPLDAKSLVPGNVSHGLQQVGQGLEVAGAVQNGDVSGALDGVAKMAPADGPIGSSLAGISALSKGDPKGAFKAAMSLAPASGPLKQGLSLASELLFGSDDKRR